MSSTASGQILWGADGHEDQGGPYTSISLQQQASDLHTVFGNGTVLYRDFGDSLSPSAEDSDVSTMQAQGIQPIIVVDTYPPWSSFSSQQDAYNWGFQQAQAMAQYFEIGNEWSADSTDFPSNGDQTQPSAWTGGPNFQNAVAVTAGAIAAIRQYAPNAKIIGGADAGWTQEGFAVALAQGLQQEYPGDMWDYTALHWYNDVAGGGSQMGNTPSDFNGGLNAYQLLKPIGKPLAITEFGSSDGNSSSNDSQAGSNITAGDVPEAVEIGRSALPALSL
jgi:hypothetical protein